jgi:hypothetical protein
MLQMVDEIKGLKKRLFRSTFPTTGKGQARSEGTFCRSSMSEIKKRSHQHHLDL